MRHEIILYIKAIVQYLSAIFELASIWISLRPKQKLFQLVLNDLGLIQYLNAAFVIISETEGASLLVTSC